jgi:hypothetical protein
MRISRIGCDALITLFWASLILAAVGRITRWRGFEGGVWPGVWGRLPGGPVAARASLRGGRSLAAAPVAWGVPAWSLTRVDPVSTQMVGPSAAALIESGVCATGYAVRVSGTTTASPSFR